MRGLTPAKSAPRLGERRVEMKCERSDPEVIVRGMTKTVRVVLAVTVVALGACKGGGEKKAPADDSAERVKAAEKWVDQEF